MPDAKQTRRSEQGFTLLEVVVAITLVAMMSVGLWAVMQTSLKSWSKGTDYIDTNQRHRSVLDLTRKQISSAYNLIIQPTADPSTGITMAAPYPFFSGTETSFQFISLNSLQFQESPGLTIVNYEASQDSQSNTLSLLERESRYLGQLPDSNSTISDKATPVLDNLISSSFEYFDPGDNQNPSAWVTEWNAQETGRMPSAVSMDIVSRDANGNTLNRKMIVPIQAATNSLTSRGRPF
jgi:prepilin-type N-terminal cleavage/methylation domain-containing protein